VKSDYYAILGVSPASEDVVIRAAYRALMRRYHPDTDSSSDSTERARAINAAYAVLSDPEQRARYDGFLAAHGLIKLERQPAVGQARAIPRPGPLAAGVLALVAGVLVLIAVSQPIAELAGAPALTGAPGGPAAPAAEQLRPAAGAADRATAACSNEGAHGLIRSELFARAGRIRGAAPAGFSAVAERAMVRVSVGEAVPQAGSAVSCSGWVAVDLPPGVVVEHGRSNLNAELGFSLVPAGFGEFRLAGLTGTEELVASLASLGRAPQEGSLALPNVDLAAPPLPPPMTPTAAPVTVHRPVAPPPVAQPRPTRTSPVPQARRTSSSCEDVNGRANRAICRNRNLAALDRQLVLFTGQSLSAADPQKKAALGASTRRFREQRDSCRSESCMTRAYVTQIREVGDIMAGRAQR
jgi:hypothetical protein